MNPIIRVFPRRTKWTPDDSLSFCGIPPIERLPDYPVYISVTFTDDVDRAKRLYDIWKAEYPDVRIGGPAFNDPGGEFVPGRFIKHGVTITSRGCPKSCPFCYASKREGDIRELEINPGYIVQDNNLLACSRSHIERVFEMLREQMRPASFPGGLDLDYVENYHIEMLKSIHLDSFWVAFDTEISLKNLDKANHLFSDFKTNQKFAYVLLGYKGDTLLAANHRCEKIYNAGFLPFAMLYDKQIDKEWKALQRKWARPAIYRNRKRNPQAEFDI